MLDRKLYKFYLSYKVNSNIELVWIEGINLRHAKDKLLLNIPEATDIMDWTYEKPEALEKYKNKFIESKNQEVPKKYTEFTEEPPKQYKEYPEDFSKFF